MSILGNAPASSVCKVGPPYCVTCATVSLASDPVSSALALKNTGHVVLNKGKTHVLLVTLNKQGKEAEHRYLDHWIDEHTFHWQSQNSTSATDKRGREIIEGEKLGTKIHLFVRGSKLSSGKSAPFIYYGLVQYLEHTGANPMSITFTLA